MLESPFTHNATYSDFDLKLLVRELKLRVSDYIYINWDQFDRIDRMKFDGVAMYFNYVWYSASDDIEIFDDLLQWVLVIRHDGAVGFIPLVQ